MGSSTQRAEKSERQSRSCTPGHEKLCRINDSEASGSIRTTRGRQRWGQLTVLLLWGFQFQAPDWALGYSVLKRLCLTSRYETVLRDQAPRGLAVDVPSISVTPMFLSNVVQLAAAYVSGVWAQSDTAQCADGFDWVCTSFSPLFKRWCGR